MSVNGEGTPTPEAETATGNGTGNSGTSAGTSQPNPRAPHQGNERTTNNPNNKKHGHSFKGATAKMNGNVFQLHSERKNKSQFGDTVKALSVYSSEVFKNDIEALTSLFTDLAEPKVEQPEDPKEVKIMVGGIETVKISKFEEMKYTEKVKQWIRDDKSLKGSVRSLYNIVWGQCSRLMQNKLTMAKDFKSVDARGDVTSLLKEIRQISLEIETNTSIYDAMDEAKAMYYKYKQEKNEIESNAKHLKNFKSLVEAIEHLGGEMFTDNELLEHKKKIDVKV